MRRFLIMIGFDLTGESIPVGFISIDAFERSSLRETDMSDEPEEGPAGAGPMRPQISLRVTSRGPSRSALLALVEEALRSGTEEVRISVRGPVSGAVDVLGKLTNRIQGVSATLTLRGSEPPL